MPEKTVLMQLWEEIDAGGLSILSTIAKDRIKTMIRLGMEDGYNRGFEDGKKKKGNKNLYGN